MLWGEISALYIWELMQKRWGKDELALVAILSHNILLQRNAVIHEEIFKNLSTMLRNAQATLDEFQKACSTTPDNQPSRSEAPLLDGKHQVRGRSRLTGMQPSTRLVALLAFGLSPRIERGKFWQPDVTLNKYVLIL